MKNVFDFLVMGVTVLTAAALVALAVTVYNNGYTSLLSTSGTAFSVAKGHLNTTESTVMGDSVVYYAESDEVKCVIYTSQHPEGFSDVTNIRNVKSSFYVDPSKEYYTRSVYDTNGLVKNILFVEQGTEPNINNMSLSDLDRTLDFLGKERTLCEVTLRNLENEVRGLELGLTEAQKKAVIEPDVLERYQLFHKFSWLEEANKSMGQAVVD